MAAHIPVEHPSVPLTRFHNNTGEFLDLATREPIALTSYGRERHFIVESAYFRRLEAIAAGEIMEAMNLKSVPSEDLTADDIAMIDECLPTEEELANDRWNDQRA